MCGMIDISKAQAAIIVCKLFMFNQIAPCKRYLQQIFYLFKDTAGRQFNVSRPIKDANSSLYFCGDRSAAASALRL